MKFCLLKYNESYKFYNKDPFKWVEKNCLKMVTHKWGLDYNYFPLFDNYYIILLDNGSKLNKLATNFCSAYLFNGHNKEPINIEEDIIILKLDTNKNILDIDKEEVIKLVEDANGWWI